MFTNGWGKNSFCTIGQSSQATKMTSLNVELVGKDANDQQLASAYQYMWPGFQQPDAPIQDICVKVSNMMPQLHSGRWIFWQTPWWRYLVPLGSWGRALSSIFGVIGADWQVVLGWVSTRIALWCGMSVLSGLVFPGCCF